MLAHLTGTLAVIGLGLLRGKRTGKGATDNVVAVMGMSCSNSSFVGYPSLLLTVAPVAGVALALNTLVETCWSFHCCWHWPSAAVATLGTGRWW